MSESTTTSEAHRAAGSIAAPTPSAPSLAATAAAAVLATTELLEHILTSLTLLDVVHAGTEGVNTDAG
ncbi:hypothetical protein B0A55_05152 [Friedmanniomyces simplex]|uniref:Uncharacterized protein n=1 Tax=Friedmanniomyces simplex TaxID=329884 RepID=A0A4V5NJH1_9PEZI|nr:hypothetical protein B0A55_05152 [Friedmanniomyces simplex]